MALNVKQQIKKQGFETSQRKKKTERRYNNHYTKLPCDITAKKILFKSLKNTHAASVFYSLPSLKNTHVDIRMLKYACWAKGNVKQISKSKNFLRIYVFFIRLFVFFCAGALILTFGKSRSMFQRSCYNAYMLPVVM